MLAFAYKSIGLDWTLGLGAALCLVAGLAMWLLMYPLIRGLKLVGEGYDFGESVGADSRSRLAGYALWSLFFVVIGVLVLLAGQDRGIALVDIGFFGSCVILFLGRIAAKSRRRRQAMDAEPVKRLATPPVEAQTVSRRTPNFGRRSKPF